MAHLHFIEDEYGDVVDNIVFCSDFCHKEYTIDYKGWNGCNEISISEPCTNCGETVNGIEEWKVCN
jgi:hypothetical protein